MSVHRCAAVVFATIIGVPVASSWGQAGSTPRADPGAPSFRELAQAKLPAVVNVSTTHPVDVAAAPERPTPELPLKDLFDGLLDPSQLNRGEPGVGPLPDGLAALGSGFLIDPEGYIVTNGHIVAGASEIRIILHDDTVLDAMLVGHDPSTDLALLKVDTDRSLPALQWGDSDVAAVGDWVVAIGNPFGLGGSVSAGIISGRARDIDQGPYDDFIQTDAAINQGNSGGPLFNVSGEVIGVNTAIFSPSGGSVGIGFAIPSDLARDVIDDLRDDGRVERGWLGVSVQPVAVAEALGIAHGTGGAIVAGIAEDSPAERAGIKVGDVIVRFGDAEVQDERALARLIADQPADSRVRVTVLRDGHRTELPVKIGRLDNRPPAAITTDPAALVPAAGRDAGFGMRVAPLTPDLRARFGIDSGLDGLVVTAVEPGSAAAIEDVRAGDVITEVARQRATAPEALAVATAAARADRHNSILLQRRRDGRTTYLILPVSADGGSSLQPTLERP